jgi:hypothetical protein
MISVNVQARVVDENGDVAWTEVKLMPSDDPSEDYVDLRLLEFSVSQSDVVMLDPVELRRALDVVAGERAKFEMEGEKVRA